MDEKYLLISMEDERAKKLADVLGNKTCKRIIDLLAEKESSEKDIADALKMPINTVEYNLKKLIQAELVEKTKTFFWSKKGKKIPTYTLSNKAIIISPKSSSITKKLKSIFPVALISGIGALAIRQYLQTLQAPLETYSMKIAEDSLAVAAPNTGANILFTEPSLAWIWFLFGTVFALILFVILNWRKM